MLNINASEYQDRDVIFKINQKKDTVKTTTILALASYFKNISKMTITPDLNSQQCIMDDKKSIL